MAMRPVLSRRRALALSAALLPSAALAQGVVMPTPPQTVAPPRPPILPPALPGITPPVVAPPTVTPAPLARPLGMIDRNGYYYLFFQQQIDVNAIKTLRAALVQLVEEGVPETTIVVSSSGGLLAPALSFYTLARALPITIHTHGANIVGSAANLLLVCGAQRSADPNARFLFHPTQTPFIASLNREQANDEMRLIDDIEDNLAAIWHERTKLPAEDIAKFRNQTVTYDAAEALRYGIVDRVEPLQIKSDRKARMFFID